MRFAVELNEEYVEKLIELTGYYFEDIYDISDEDVEYMICELIDNV